MPDLPPPQSGLTLIGVLNKLKSAPNGSNGFDNDFSSNSII